MGMINKILLGDCLEVMKRIPDNKIDAIITDPPYSLDYEFENDNLTYEKQAEFMELYSKEFYRVLKIGGTVALFMSQEMTHFWYFIANNIGFSWQNEIIWQRDGGQMPTKKLGICHEIINIYSKGNPKTFNLDLIRVKSKYAETDKRLNPKGKNPGDVWYEPALFGKKKERLSENGKAIHPTQKPKEIIRPLVIAYSNENDIILDPFTGLATIPLIAKEENRRFIGIEKDNHYWEVANKRIAELNV